MNTALYYFSGTGNSLSVAKSIKEGLGKCEIFPIIGCLKQKTIQVTAQRIGLVFPMHFMGVPRIVLEFLTKARFNNPQYIFVVVTGANPKFGNAFSQVEKSLLATNTKLNAGYFVPMVAAHFPYIKLSATKQPAIQYQEAKEKVSHICENIRQLTTEFDTEFTIVGEIKQLVSKKATSNEKHFTVGDGCIRCGYCMQVCPFQNIRLHGKQIQWMDNCHSCFACLHFCSKSVIQYKKLSIGKPRYHHPSISLNDIALQREKPVNE